MLKLMYITNKPEVAKIAEETGVDRIFVDLEVIGKKERQGGMNTVQSTHTLRDVAIIKQALSRSELLVRANPIHSGSEKEIDTLVRYGADIVMLPYFKSANEVIHFLDYVDGRAQTCLLVETPEAVAKMDGILALDGIDEVHIGLNDLHLAYHKKFMFELLTDGTVESLRDKILAKGIPYGFGGIARIGKGELPAEAIIKEHYRLDSTRAILSRSFCNTDLITDLGEVREIFSAGMAKIRSLEEEIGMYKNYFIENRENVEMIVSMIAERQTIN